MPTQTIATPVMTDLTSALYRVAGDMLDAAMLAAEQAPGPDTEHAMEVCALVYDLVATEYGLA